MAASFVQNNKISGIAPTKKLWRYMNLAKYLWLLDRGSLYFARSDVLQDKFEGSWTERDSMHREQANNEALSSPGMPPAVREMAINSLRDARLLNRKHTYLNCWHMNDYESMAMWSIYGQLNYGISLQTTLRELTDVLPQQAEIGAITYLDFRSGSFFTKERKWVTPFLFKRISFEFENEMRCIITVPGIPGVEWLFTKVTEYGLSVPIDLSKLIDSIYISPSSDNSFHELVQNLTARYGFEFAVRKSSIDTDALY